MLVNFNLFPVVALPKTGYYLEIVKDLPMIDKLMYVLVMGVWGDTAPFVVNIDTKSGVVYDK